MKKSIYIFLPFLLFIFSCKDSEETDLSQPGVTGTLNGSPVDFSSIVSDVVNSNGAETAYIVMRKDFQGFNQPATNGQQLLIRIEPYDGPGTYRVNANTFWVYEEEINNSGNSFSSILHRFSSDESTGSMLVEITEDEVKQGKRTLVGKFEGVNGITEKVSETGSQTQTLKTMDFKNVGFVAPKGAF